MKRVFVLLSVMLQLVLASAPPGFFGDPNPICNTPETDDKFEPVPDDEPKPEDKSEPKPEDESEPEPENKSEPEPEDKSEPVPTLVPADTDADKKEDDSDDAARNQRIEASVNYCADHYHD